MPDKKELEAPLPADVAREDSVGGMARRLLEPAHIKQVAAWCAQVGREEGLEALWREVEFRIRLALHVNHLFISHFIICGVYGAVDVRERLSLSIEKINPPVTVILCFCLELHGIISGFTGFLI